MSDHNSPLLFDLDELFSDSPTFANPRDLLLKSEPDPMTIQLGWGNDALNNTHHTHTSSNALIDISESMHHPPIHSGVSVSVPRTAESSAFASVSAPALAPTATIDDPALFSSSFWHGELMNGFDIPFNDAKGPRQYSDHLHNSANPSIPWAQWTNVNPTEFEPDHSRDDPDMPPTPVDAFSINVDLYQPHQSDLAYPQSSPQNHDLLSPFNSLGLSSPPMYSSSIQPSCPSDAQAPGVNTLYGPPSMYYDPQSVHPHYDTPSPPASIVSVPPTSLDLSSANVKVIPTIDHYSQASRRNNHIPTLSSSLPTSLASPHSHSGHHLSKPSPTSRASPPAQANSATRGTRSRTVSDISRPSQRRRGHSSQDVSETGGPIDSLKPPKQSLSTWQFFFTEWIQKQDGRKLNVAQAAKEAGKEYKMLTDDEKEPYARRAAEARMNRQQALNEWHQTLTPSLIALENRYRTAQRKMGLSRRSNLKDPNAPKKPLSAYFMFLKAVREDAVWSESVFGPEKETTRQSVLAAARWREMSDDEKRPFLARAEQEKLQYEAARKVYEDSFNFEESAAKSNAHSLLGYSTFEDFSASPRPRSNSTGSTAMAFRLDDMSSEQAQGDGAPSMGYFSATPSNNATIPIHIPRGRPRSGSSPSPTAAVF